MIQVVVAVVQLHPVYQTGSRAPPVIIGVLRQGDAFPADAGQAIGSVAEDGALSQGIGDADRLALTVVGNSRGLTIQAGVTGEIMVCVPAELNGAQRAGDGGGRCRSSASWFGMLSLELSPGVTYTVPQNSAVLHKLSPGFPAPASPLA